jgi:phage gp36-like protein
MYCTEAQFKARFGEKELQDLLDSDVGRDYASAAADADAVIDGYIGSRYTLPLPTVPAFILGIAADLTRYELYEEAPTKEVIERRKVAMDMLRDIRAGILVLAGATTSSVSGGVEVSARPQVFTEETLDRFAGGL